MAKICVISDSHGCTENLLRAMEEEMPEYVVFLAMVSVICIELLWSYHHLERRCQNGNQTSG